MKNHVILVLSIVVATLAASAAFAQEGGTIGYSPVSCVRAGEMPVLQVSLDRKGVLRAYFRRVNTTDWCSVEGKNEAALSSVTLPKFDLNDEIEYYFLLLDGRQVIAKSPQIYRVRVSNQCETPFSRHSQMIVLDCGTRGPGSMPASSAAGYTLKGQIIPPKCGSNDRRAGCQ